MRLLDVAQDRAGASDASDAFLRFAQGAVGHRARDEDGPAARDPGRAQRATRSSPAAPRSTASPPRCSSRSRGPTRCAASRSSAGRSSERSLSDDVATAELARRQRRRRPRPHRGRGAARRRLRPGPGRRARGQRAQRDARPAGDPAHARARGRARAQRRLHRRLPRRQASRARSRPPATACPRAGTACASRPARASPAGVLMTGATVVQHDYASDLPLADTAKTVLAVPMSWNDEMRGVLSVGWAARRRVHDEDQHTTEAIAGLATLACRNAEAYEHVQHVARTDALTGVLNHGAMQIRDPRGDRPRPPRQRSARRRHPRPRRLQERQRHPRPRRRRRAAAHGRERAPARAAPVRPGRPLRRRRVRPAAARLRRGDDRARRRALPRRDRRQVLDRRRRLARRPRRRRAARAGRPRADAGQAHRQGPRRDRQPGGRARAGPAAVPGGLTRGRPGAGRRDRGARPLHARALRRGRPALAAASR